jgi:hypothetical protein
VETELVCLWQKILRILLSKGGQRKVDQKLENLDGGDGFVVVCSICKIVWVGDIKGRI